MGNTSEKSQTIIEHLLSCLTQKSGDTDFERKKKILGQCLAEMQKKEANTYKIAQEIEPIKEDLIPVLVQALRLSGTESFVIKSNAVLVLERVGNHQAVVGMLEHFDDCQKGSGHSFTKLLKRIAEREGEETKKQIAQKCVQYLHDHYSSSPGTIKKRADQAINTTFETLLAFNALDDLRIVNLLDAYVSHEYKDSETYQSVLTALASLDPARAKAYLNQMLKPPQSSAEGITLNMHALYNRIEKNSTTGYVTLTAIEQDASPSAEERVYLFKYEQPSVHFLGSGRDEKWARKLAGLADNVDESLDCAIQYVKTNYSTIKDSKTKFQEANQVLRKYFDFKTWGFNQVYVEPNVYPTIIYRSEQCKVQFSFDSSGNPHDTELHLHIYYGRSHATNNDSFMDWNGEKCWCWHRVDYALNFLDGLSPQEAAEVEYSPRVIEQYRNSERAGQLSKRTHAEWSAGMETQIWEEYGERLFEVFDLRNIELWEQYVNFRRQLSEYSKYSSFERPDGFPPKHKVC